MLFRLIIYCVRECLSRGRLPENVPCLIERRKLKVKVDDDITVGGKVIEVKDGMIYLQLPENIIAISEKDIKTIRHNRRDDV